MKLRDVKLHPRNFLLAAALLTAAPLCLTGCINDDEPWGEEEKFELTEGTEYYIGVTVPVKVLPGHAADDATPAQLVAIANPPFNYDKFLVSMKSLTDIKLKLSEVATSSMAGPQYMMSSSTYYEDGKATFATKVSTKRAE